MAHDPSKDKRNQWLKNRVELSFNKKNDKKFDKAFYEETNCTKYHDFFDMEDNMLLSISETLRVDLGAPPKLAKGKFIFITKSKPTDVNADNIDEVVLVNEVSGGNPHEWSRLLADACFKRVVTSSANKERWGDVAQREMLEHFNKYLGSATIMCGHVKGVTTLPLPTGGGDSSSSEGGGGAHESGGSGGDGASDPQSIKHKLSVCEGAVIGWTQQVRDAVTPEPEDCLTVTETEGANKGKPRTEHLTPDREVAFWESRAKHLNDIWEQITGPQICKVVDFLAQQQSIYATAFQKTIKECDHFRAEANDNLKYLQTLSKWFSKLNEQDDFDGLTVLFKPIIHTILLIWKNSAHYNVPMRLVVLMRMISNAVINQAVKFVSGSDAIFGFLESEEFAKAADTIRTALRVAGALKSTYFDFRDAAQSECPKRPWAVAPAAIFTRLNGFMERAMDMLELCNTYGNFFKLEKMVEGTGQAGGLGGTKGGTLTETVRDIYHIFKTAAETLKTTGYDLFDISAPKFDEDYGKFKTTIKELERRLSAVIHLAFLDRTTPVAKFKLFESFDSLVKRSAIEDDLEAKYVHVVNDTLAQLLETQRVYLAQHDAPPIHATAPNQPPVAGALVWAAGLYARMEAPMAKFRELGDSMLNREEAREVLKTAEALKATLHEFQEQKREEWRRDCMATFHIKLTLPLLVRHPPTKHHGGHLEVNFAPELVRLLREAKYFLSLNLEIPQNAAELYAKVETFTVWCEQMDMVAGLNNEMLDGMLPVEKPLLKPYMDKFNGAVEAGITTLNWESEGVDEFIENVLAAIRAAHAIYGHMKHNLHLATEEIAKWAESPMLERKQRPTDLKEFLSMQKNPQAKVYAMIKESSKELQHLLKHSHHELHLSNSDPTWMSYVNFTNNLCVAGLSQVVSVGLSYLLEQLDPDNIKEQDLQPLVEVSLDLVGGAVAYSPEVRMSGGKGGGVRDCVNKCIGAIMNVGHLMKRFDNPEGGFIRELHGNPMVCMTLGILTDTLNDTEENLEELKLKFLGYGWLWETDLDVFFADFQKDAVTTSELGQEFLDLDKFHAALTKYEGVREEISKIPSPTDVGHVRVNVIPIKQALTGNVERWIAKFLDALQANIRERLSNVETIITRSTEGLKETSSENEEGRETLNGIMRTLREVNGQDAKVQELFDPMAKTVALCRKHGVSVSEIKINGKEVNDVLEDAPMSWKDLVGVGFRKKEEIFELQRVAQDAIKEEAEVFWAEIREFRTNFRNQGPFAFQGEVQEAYDQLDAFSAQLVEMEAGAQLQNGNKELYDLPTVDYIDTKNTREELGALKRMWDFKANVASVFADWKTMLWNQADTEALEDRNKAINKNLRGMANENPVMKGWQVYRDIEESIKNMGTVLELMTELHSPAMRSRHWQMLAHTCGVKSLDPTNPKCTLNDIIVLNLHEFRDDVSEIVETATKELKIETKLAAVEKNWATIEMNFEPSRSNPDIKVIKPSELVVEGLDADQLELQTVLGMGKFMEFFKDRVLMWNETLGLMQSTLSVWEKVTHSWASLEPIFLYSEDIRSQLPDDTKRFEGIHNEFVEMMKSAADVSSCRESLTVDGREASLRSMLERLNMCQKSLNEYLDVKKTIYPRFYFVSAVALLDMLANGTYPPKIMPYLGDCYDALADCQFVTNEDGTKSTKTVDMMVAKDKETCPLGEPFTMEGEVETYLNDLTAAMISSIKLLMCKACDTASTWDQAETTSPREMWLFDFCCQNALTTTQIFWTSETTTALEEYEMGAEDAVKKYLHVCNVRLNKLIELVLTDLKEGDRVKIITLITMDVHSRDVVDKCIHDKIEGPGTFLWQQQLRFYWQESTMDVAIKICDFQTLYFYEWVGNTGRLVITPLTDRCYITLTMALRLFLGGAPAGPAGTGKTETTKDLARALAIPCYVFNCSDQMNFQTMADIFRGLAQTGAWGCFDEFNRISIEVLSVVASQVKTVQDAVVRFSVPGNRDPEYQMHPAGTPPVTVGFFDFEGTRISLIPTAGFWITMNPGYAGRTELPENLKALFRSCAMIRPDLKPICENMLMSEGFVTARVLSIKFVTLYQLSSELLSKQPHYDWGLRAVKSVLRVAGSMKRTSPNATEAEVLMRALRDFNTPKIPVHDTPVFMRLIDDLFMGLSVPLVYDQVLLKKIARAAEEMKLQGTELFYLKTHQFQELLDVRHSVMLLGPAGCAKTEIWKCLQWAHNLDKPKKTCVAETVNPKSVSGNELYGYMTMSKEWKDGALSIVMRGMAKNFAEQGFFDYQTYKWVVLDGDIDAVWIESMNTVMDDNKVLTLVSNERVPLSRAMRMVFEINSLKNATPATVSRAGILFINETDVGWLPMVQTWAQAKEDKNLSTMLPKMFDEMVPKFIELTRKGFKECTPMYKLNKVETVMRMLDFLTSPENCAPDQLTKDVLTNFFMFAAMWAWGGPMVTDKQADYKARFSEAMTSGFPEWRLPQEGTCFDYFFDLETMSQQHWKTKVGGYTPIPIGGAGANTPFTQLCVATVNSTRMTFVMDSLVRRARNVMFVGTAGTGKTMLIKEYLKTLDKDADGLLSETIVMSYYTESLNLQTEMDLYIDKRAGRIYGPPATKKLVLFFDDLNLPQIETYGTQNAIALLTQQMQHGSLFDRDDLGFRKEIVDVQYVAAMNPTAGSFNVCERAQIRFSTFDCAMPNHTDLETIYSSIFDGHLMGFNDSIQQMAHTVVKAGIHVLDVVGSKFLPSAVKFTYNWNMRELTNIFQGLCLSREADFERPHEMVRLFVHETERVICDRLVNEKDIADFSGMLAETVKKEIEAHVKLDMDHVWQEPRVYTNFALRTDGSYLPVPSIEKLKAVLDTKLLEYNESFAQMDLVLFNQALEHVCRIGRILMNPGGNVMCIGVGGSGKQSLSRLASSIQGMEVKQMAITGAFKVDDLKEALKEYFKIAIIKNTPIVWLMTDSQIVNDRFLIYINSILSAGWVSDLFPKDEIDAMLGAIRGEAKAAGVPDTPEANFSFLVKKSRCNFHVILCFSPVGDTFRIRARRFPGLINCTSIDFFHAWPEQALISVAMRFVGELEGISDEVKSQLSQHMAFEHLSSGEQGRIYLETQRRFNYVTPKSFLELIDFYKSMLVNKRAAVEANIDRLDTGLATLNKVKADVDELMIDLKHTLEVVAEKVEKTDALLVYIGKEKEAATVQENAAAETAKAADAASASAAAIQANADVELKQATPAMEAAADAVNCLSKAALTELKGFGQCPGAENGNKVMAGCLVLIEHNHSAKVHNDLKKCWDSSKKMMGDVGAFLATLQEYDGRTIPEEEVQILTKWVEDDPDFNYERMVKSSVALANLAGWVINIYKFNRIYVKVAPLMESLEEAKASKAESDESLAVAMGIVAEVRAKLAKLATQLEEAVNEKNEVQANAAYLEARGGIADRLINGLSSEKIRWEIEIEKLRTMNELLIGDSMLGAGFASYVGGFDADNREALWRDQWLPDIIKRGIPCSEGVVPIDLLTDSAKTAVMIGEGLPADTISIENGSIITSCKRWPLIIDPQVQGIKWLRQKEEPNGLVVTQLTAKDWIKKMQNGIANGTPVIVENLTTDIDATLDPVLARAVIKKGRSFVLFLAGEEIDYSPEFRLYLQTKLANPHYKPEIAAQCTLINFIATERGLEDQLLAKVVGAERPDLEETAQRLQSEFQAYKIQLMDLENDLLNRLANAPEDILSDVPLIEAIEATKATAVRINAAIDAGNITEQEIGKAREHYRIQASEGAMLYFLLQKLCFIDHMYQYSLDSFVFFFFKSISTATAAETVQARVVNLKDCLRMTIFTWVARGLFVAHKLIFLGQLMFNLMKRGNLGEDARVDEVEFQFLMRGPRKMGEDNPIGWLPDSAWQSCQALMDLPDYSNICADLVEGSPRFKEWYNLVTPEDEKLPMDYAQLDKTPFKKMLVTRCLRPDRMLTSMESFIRATMPNGDAYADCDGTLNAVEILDQSYLDSTPVVPIYFILSPGANVVADLDVIAKKYGMTPGVTYNMVSMGQGQDVIAERFMHAGHREGHWTILCNIHLMISWLGKLEKTLDDFAIEGSHAKFRMFFSSDPAKGIPIGILARCIKLTNEPPAGLKAKLKNALCFFPKELFEEADSKTKSILFGLCHYHGLMLERKAFGPLGYNMKYPFAIADLRDSAVCLQNYMENSGGGKIPWEDLKYIFGDIMYGGHIVNDFDRLMSSEYLNFIMKDELLDETEMYPFSDGEKESFKSPAPTTQERYIEHINMNMGADTPIAFGLHPNAEIDFRTTASEQMFRTILELQPRTAGGGGNALSPQQIAEGVTSDLLDKFSDKTFDVEDVQRGLEAQGPYQNVLLQEMSVMNVLLDEMRRSLRELVLGFKGELTMSDKMEGLMNSLYMDQIPPGWAKISWPSKRGLTAWIPNFLDRLTQLDEWCGNPMELLKVTWVSGFVNPQAFLTAVLQVAAQKNQWELDKLVTMSDVLKQMTPDEVPAPAKDGAYINGLSLEGARWDAEKATVDKSRPKELFVPMPVMCVRGISLDRADMKGVYHCPLYVTNMRGPTYVTRCQLKTKSPAAQWVLAGVALIMDMV